MVEHTYPQVVWRDGQKLLWNPIHRKALKNRPEERVRLRIIESLVAAGWSKHRISTEESIGKPGDSAMRTDIICYDQQFEPRILIECKAEHIPISSRTAEQIARYNRQVSAPLVMMSNGVKDFWYEISDGQINELESPPKLLDKNPKKQNYRFEDWQKRGFAGAKADHDLRKWVEKNLSQIWFNCENSEIRFLNFIQGLTDLNLNHYYRLKSFSKKRKVALTTVNTPFGGSRLVAIFNQNHQNEGVLEVNLDLLFDEQKGNSSLYSETGTSIFDLRSFYNLKQVEGTHSIFENLMEIFEGALD